MARKIWYYIELIDTRKDYPENCEVVAKVKSKGLAEIVYNQVKETYKNSKCLVHIR